MERSALARENNKKSPIEHVHHIIRCRPHTLSKTEALFVVDEGRYSRLRAFTAMPSSSSKTGPLHTDVGTEKGKSRLILKLTRQATVGQYSNSASKDVGATQSPEAA